MIAIRVSQRFANRILTLVSLVCFFLLPMLASAQSLLKRSLITQPIDESKLTTLKGNTYLLARTEFDRGAAPLDLPMQRMLLVLKRTPEQEAALDSLLDQQQDKSSPNYHAWLTPEQFGQQFGPADQDIAAITGWLQSHGFQVAKVSNGRTVIEFSGTAAQVQEAFHTSIHKYNVDGTDHWANSSDPQIPTALAPAVAGPLTLHNFPRKAMHDVAGIYTRKNGKGELSSPNSLFTFPSSNCGGNCYAVGPYDFATIYSVLPLWNATPPAPVIDGTGETIAIVAESDIDIQDVRSFRAFFALPPNDPQFKIDGPDPGIVQGDETESDLDVQWSGAVAKGATILFVPAATTNSTLGVDLSAQYIVDNNLAPILSESYGICELGLGVSGNQFFNQLWQQASAEGITAILSSGDSGSATCDRFEGAFPEPAKFGLAVSGFASTPYNVAVGGTDFNDLFNWTPYWNSTSAPNTMESAKGYVPEMTWNNSCTNAEVSVITGTSNALSNCNNFSQNTVGFVIVDGGSGGASNCTTSDGQHASTCSGGYPKPAWQKGLGVPADNVRDIPDVSLFASNGFNNSFYVICEADQTSTLYCAPGNQLFLAIGGTSASAPSFAGIMALVVEKTGSRQGNANYVLYKLAAQPGASCTSAVNPPTACIFNDVVVGTIAMPCVPNTRGCGQPGAQGIGVLSGYAATPNYDLATGLGSVNATSLVSNWASASSTLEADNVTLSLTPTPVNIMHGAPVNVNISIAAKPPATGTPSGLVSLVTSAGDPAASFILNSGSVSSTTSTLPGGSYTVTAHYPGDGTFGIADSAPPLSVTVAPEPSTTKVSAFTGNLFTNPTPFTSGPYGAPIFLRADVAGVSGNGTPTGQINFTGTVAGVTSNLPGDPYTLNGGGNTFTPNGILGLSPGQYSIVATYSGDASFQPSNTNATPLSITITKAPTSIQSVDTGGTTNVGNNVNLVANLNGSGCGVLPTGTITFFTGSTPVGTAPVQPVISQPCSSLLRATLNTTALPVGLNSITAIYNGDTNYAASPRSQPGTIDIVIPTTESALSSQPTIQQGQSVTFTANVVPGQNGGPPMTGTVGFTSSELVNLLCNSPISNGTATCLTAALPVGTQTIDMIYSGDTNYGSSFATLMETVTPGPDFGVSANPQTIIVPSPGSTGSTVLTFTALNGFTGTINLSPSLCSGLPSESGCSFSASSVTFGGTSATAMNKPLRATTTGGTTMTVTLTVSTMAPSSAVPQQRHGPASLGPLANLLAVMIAILFLLSVSSKRKRWHTAFATFLAIATLLTFAACGGGSSGTTGPPPNPGTPVGLDPNVVVIFSSGNVSHNLPLSVNVE